MLDAASDVQAQPTVVPAGGRTRLLFLLYDPLPPFRPDVVTLFGQELPKLGIDADLLGQGRLTHADGSDATWPAGAMWSTGPLRKGLLGELTRPWHDLRGMLRRLTPQHRVIQVRDKIRTGLIGLVVARLTGRRFTYWMSFPFAEGFKVRAQQVGSSQGRLVQAGNYLRAALAGPIFYKLVAPRADRLFVQSEAMLEFMAAKGVPRERMTAVPMGVDLDVFNAAAPLSPRPQRLQGREVVAYLGVLGRARQSDFLIKVFSRIRQERPKALLLLIGDGPSPDEQHWMRDQIAISGLSEEDVWLTGWLPQQEAVALLRHASVALSPVPRGALYDVSSPTKAVEYLALGIPCVGSDIPDQEFVLKLSGGGLSVQMTMEDFAQATLQILGNHGLAAHLRASGPSWVAGNRSYGVLSQDVANVYLALRRTTKSPLS